MRAPDQSGSCDARALPVLRVAHRRAGARTLSFERRSADVRTPRRICPVASTGCVQASPREVGILQPAHQLGSQTQAGPAESPSSEASDQLRDERAAWSRWPRTARAHRRPHVDRRRRALAPSAPMARPHVGDRPAAQLDPTDTAAVRTGRLPRFNMCSRPEGAVPRCAHALSLDRQVARGAPPRTNWCQAVAGEPGDSPGTERVAALGRFETARPSFEPGLNIGPGQHDAVGREGLEVRGGKGPRELRRRAAVHYLSQHSSREDEGGRSGLAARRLSVVLLRPGHSTYALADQVQLGSEVAPSCDE
jgi:hypothetical protein